MDSDDKTRRELKPENAGGVSYVEPEHCDCMAF